MSDKISKFQNQVSELKEKIGQLKQEHNVLDEDLKQKHNSIEQDLESNGLLKKTHVLTQRNGGGFSFFLTKKP